MTEERNLLMAVAKLQGLQMGIHTLAFQCDWSRKQKIVLGCGLICAILTGPISWITGTAVVTNMIFFLPNLKALSVSEIICNHYTPQQQKTLVRQINQKLNTIITPSASDFEMNVACDSVKAKAVAETVISFVNSQPSKRLIYPEKVQTHDIRLPV